MKGIAKKGENGALGPGLRRDDGLGDGGLVCHVGAEDVGDGD
jgi:hypothetical protein